MSSGKRKNKTFSTKEPDMPSEIRLAFEKAGIVDTQKDARQIVVNKDTKWKIQTSKKVHKETLAHKGSSEVNAIKYLPYIDGITEKAILLDSAISDKDNPNSLMFHSMYAYSEIFGYPALLRLRVEELYYHNREDSGELMRNYILQNIEEEPISKLNRLSRSNRSEKDSFAISIAQLYDIVKTYDKDYVSAPQISTEVAKRSLNEDGTPKSLYHQTANEITVFDPRHEGAGTNDDETPFGIFMKPTADDIGLKGKKQMDLYALIVNPLVVDNCAELVRELKIMSSKYADMVGQRNSMSAEYKKKIELATQAYSYMKNGRNRTADTVLYEKEIGDKSYYVVQAVAETKKENTLYSECFHRRKRI